MKKFVIGILVAILLSLPMTAFAAHSPGGNSYIPIETETDE